MYLLDTNVVSELRRTRTGRADQNVLAWTNSIPLSNQFLSAISVLEIEIGALRVERRDPVQGAALRSWIEEYVLPHSSEEFFLWIPLSRKSARGSMFLINPLTETLS